jgi:Zn-dependent peptidase ImmA (M78 family)
MSRSEYYDRMKKLARATRAEYGLCTPRVLKADLRRIYKDHGIRIDLWQPKLRRLRGAYFNDELGPTVMLARSLPPDPMVFTMAHELKHHLVDSDLALSFCDQSNELMEIEIGAEIFAAELIFPEHDFIAHYRALNVSRCTPEVLVRLKNSTQTTLSYAGLAKRAEFLGVATSGSLQKFHGWKKIEEELFGVPLYKQILLRKRGYI